MPQNTELVIPPTWRAFQPTLVTTTFASAIWRVEREDGSTAIIKALRDFPDVWDELRGAFFLDWRDGVGAARLFAVEGRMMLLEDGGSRLLTEVIATENDAAATKIAGEVLGRLHSPSERPIPSELQPLQERFASLFAKAALDRSGQPASIYIEAAETAARLLGDQQNVRPLHGDLHHENIIFGPRGWLVIDPKGILGDPAFDAGNMFYNPLDARAGLALDPDRIAFMAETFGRVLDQPPARILDFAFAYGCLSAAWHAEDGNAEDEGLELGVAKAIRRVRATF